MRQGVRLSSATVIEQSRHGCPCSSYHHGTGRTCACAAPLPDPCCPCVFLQPALERLAASADTARLFTATMLLNERITAVGEATGSAERLALAAAYLQVWAGLGARQLEVWRSPSQSALRVVATVDRQRLVAD